MLSVWAGRGSCCSPILSGSLASAAGHTQAVLSPLPAPLAPPCDRECCQGLLQDLCRLRSQPLCTHKHLRTMCGFLWECLGTARATSQTQFPPRETKVPRGSLITGLSKDRWKPLICSHCGEMHLPRDWTGAVGSFNIKLIPYIKAAILDQSK